MTGFFDGDGNVNVRIKKFTLLFRLDFADSFENQLVQISQFLHRHGVRYPSIQKYFPKKGRPSFSLRIDRKNDVLRAAKSMLPFAYKKSVELALCIDYLENRVTGRRCLESLNRLVKAGIRSGDIRDGSHLPFTHEKGVHRAKLLAAKASRSSNSKLTDIERKEVRRKYSKGGSTSLQLATEYGVTKSTILRVLKRRKS